MANRNTLHFNKLPLFMKYLVSEGYEILPTRDASEVLRAMKSKEKIIIYKKSGAVAHCSVSNKDLWLVREFLKKVN